MSYSIVYSSKTGNTKLLADTIHAELPAEDCVYFGEANEAALTADKIYVGFWTDKGSCDADTEKFLKTIQGKEVFLFGTAGFGGSEDYFQKILSRTEKHLSHDSACVGSFMCQGKMPMSVRERYEKMSKSPIPVPNIKNMIANFDSALSHPDEKDLSNLKEAIKNK